MKSKDFHSQQELDRVRFGLIEAARKHVPTFRESLSGLLAKLQGLRGADLRDAPAFAAWLAEWHLEDDRAWVLAWVQRWVSREELWPRLREALVDADLSGDPQLAAWIAAREIPTDVSFVKVFQTSERPTVKIHLEPSPDLAAQLRDLTRRGAKRHLGLSSELCRLADEVERSPDSDFTVRAVAVLDRLRSELGNQTDRAVLDAREAVKRHGRRGRRIEAQRHSVEILEGEPVLRAFDLRHGAKGKVRDFLRRAKEWRRANGIDGAADKPINYRLLAERLFGQKAAKELVGPGRGKGQCDARSAVSKSTQRLARDLKLGRAAMKYLEAPKVATAEKPTSRGSGRRR